MNISTFAVYFGASMFLFFIFAVSFLAGECASGGGENSGSNYNNSAHGNTVVGKEEQNKDIKNDRDPVVPTQETPSQPEVVNSSSTADNHNDNGYHAYRRGFMKQAEALNAPAATIQKLKEENTKFFKLLYDPLQTECNTSLFKHAFSAPKESLCGTVRNLNNYVPSLEKSGAEKYEIAEYVRDAIHSDTKALNNKYFLKLSQKLRVEIKDKVNGIQRDELFTKFETSYSEFMKKKDAASVYELLLIGKMVAQIFEKTSVVEQQVLAYQQFAINLTIHSIDIGRTKSEDGKTHDIRAIAEKWPVHEQWEKLAATAAAVLNFEQLKKQNQEFLTLLYEPLKEECDTTNFRDEFSAEKKSLCETMEWLNMFVPNLMAFMAASKNKIAYYSQLIRDTIHKDVQELSYKYYQMLGNPLGSAKKYNKFSELFGNKRISYEYYKVEGNTVRNDIIKEVVKIAPEDLLSEFKKSYGKFMEEEGKEAAKKDAARNSATKGGQTNSVESNSHPEIVFKLLLIGERVAEMFLQTNVDALKQQTLAYQQFAINLTIHSIHIDISVSTDGKTHDIRAIAQKWHEIFATIQKLKEENTKFFKLLYDPLQTECNTSLFKHAFSAPKESLCGTVRNLNKYVPSLKREQAKLLIAADKGKIRLLSLQIRDIIHSDTTALNQKYYAMLERPLSAEIFTTVDKIVPEELFEGFKTNYDEFIKEENNVANVHELLLICPRVKLMFEKGSVVEQQALAYQQFAINLMIHSIDIGRTKSEDGKTHDIRAIAKEWPDEEMRKLADAAAAIVQPLIDLKKENANFVKLLYAPLLEECDTTLGETFSAVKQRLCHTVEMLKIYVPRLQTDLKRLTETYSISIRDEIHRDMVDLFHKYYQLLGEQLRDDIIKKLRKIANKDLISEFKNSYNAAFNKEEKDAANKGEDTNAAEPKRPEQIVFELLLIGKWVEELFKKASVEEVKQQAWAYYQFAISLAIYSIDIGPTKHDILAIAMKWTVDVDLGKFGGLI